MTPAGSADPEGADRPHDGNAPDEPVESAEPAQSCPYVVVIRTESAVLYSGPYPDARSAAAGAELEVSLNSDPATPGWLEVTLVPLTPAESYERITDDD